MKRTRITVLLAACLLLAACALREVDPPAENGGVGRIEPADTGTPSENADPPQIPGTDIETPDTETAQTAPGETRSAEPDPPATQSAETDPPAVQPAVTAPPETAAPETQPAAATAPVVTASDSLKPFGASAYWTDGGKYYYDLPSRPNAGRATVDEMYSFPGTRFADASDPDNWYPGSVTYDYYTGEVTYNWDRYQSTKDVFEEYGAIYRGDETRKVVYLTFDCGYEYGYTATILDTLRDKQAPATFFITGPYARTEHELIGRMLNEGHVVGNHTNNHLDMTTLSVEDVISEMDEVEKAYKEAFPDAPDMLYFRPPAGACNEWLIRLEAKLGYRTVTWSFAHNDWNTAHQPDVASALENARTHLHPGCVFLLHAQSSTNAAILGDLIDYIRAQGYEILPLCSIE